MKYINKIVIITIVLILLVNSVVFAASYGTKRFDANQTKETNNNSSNNNNKNKSKNQNQQKKSGSTTTIPSYKNIPRSVGQKRDEIIKTAFTSINNGKPYYYTGLVGSYKYPVTITVLVPSIEPIGTVIDNWQLTNMKKVEKVVEKTGSYILRVSGNLNNSTYTNTNTRVKDYTWTVKNETTGTTRPKFVTEKNYTYITFYEPGTYYIKAEETLIYDVNRVDRVTYQITASHTGETLQSGTKTRTTYIESKTTPGKVTEWRIVITEEDLGKKIPIGDTKNKTGPKPISKSSSEPSNKINVEVDYELVE